MWRQGAEWEGNLGQWDYDLDEALITNTRYGPLALHDQLPLVACLDPLAQEGMCSDADSSQHTRRHERPIPRDAYRDLARSAPNPRQ